MNGEHGWSMQAWMDGACAGGHEVGMNMNMNMNMSKGQGQTDRPVEEKRSGRFD